MERKHGYFLEDFFHDFSNKQLEELYDLCEAFIEGGGKNNRIENDDWQILGEQCAVISIMNKQNLKNYTVNMDIDKESELANKQAWADMAEEERIYDEEVKKNNDSIIDELRKTHDDSFINDVITLVKDMDSGVYGKWEVVDKITGSYQEEDELESIKGIWVDQFCNGGWTGDDFQGYMYILIGEGKYLRMTYSC